MGPKKYCETDWMKSNYPIKLTVYAVDNRPGLHSEFLESVKTKDFAKNVEFADTIRREGIRVG